MWGGLRVASKRRVLNHTLIDRLNRQFQIELFKFYYVTG